MEHKKDEESCHGCLKFHRNRFQWYKLMWFWIQSKLMNINNYILIKSNNKLYQPLWLLTFLAPTWQKEAILLSGLSQQ